MQYAMPMTDRFQERLAAALAADDLAAFGALVEEFRPWLELLARRELDGPLRAKVDAGDVVQETLLRACRDRDTVRARERGSFAAWLRSILGHALAHEVRRFRSTQKRDVALEVSIHVGLESSTTKLAALAADGTSPSVHAVREERSVALAGALARLPEDYREVLLLRHLDGLSHDEIAARLRRSPGAVRMLWTRALSQLRKEVEPWSD